MEIAITNQQSEVSLSGLEQLTRKVLAAACLHRGLTPEAEVAVCFVDDLGITQLNAAYRRIHEPTDVLSFPQDDGEQPFEWGTVLGDIVISLPRAAAQANEYGHSLERELGFLLVHGFLHLLGYDHGHPDDAKKMRQEEEAVLAKLDLDR